MRVVQRIGEGLARRTTRRQNLQVVFGGLFGTVAAWAVEGPFGSGALAGRCVVRYSSTECSPPDGLYCTNTAAGGDPGYCDGARCAGGCTPYDYWYPQPRHTTCWCTAIQLAGGERFYYKCCDCQCDFGGAATACGCKGKVTVDWSGPATPKRRRGRR